MPVSRRPDLWETDLGRNNGGRSGSVCGWEGRRMSSRVLGMSRGHHVVSLTVRVIRENLFIVVKVGRSDEAGQEEAKGDDRM